MNKINLKKTNQPLIYYISNFFRNIVWYNVLISIITLVIVAFVCIYFHSPNTVEWKIGDIATKTIIASSPVSYEDTKTEQLIKEEIIDNTIGYQENPSLLIQIISNIKLLFNTIISNRSNPNITQKEVDNLKLAIGPYISGKLSDDSLLILLTIDDKILYQIENDVLDIENDILRKNLKDNTFYINKAYKEAGELLEKKYPKSKYNDLTLEIIKNTLKPNLIYSEEKTAELRRAQEDKFPKIYRTIAPGEVIVSKGETISEYSLEVLKQAGFYKNKLTFFENSIGIICLILFGYVYIIIFLKKFNLIIYDYHKSLLFGIILVFSMSGFWIMGSILMNSFDNYRLGYIAIMWIIASAMLVYNLLSRYLAFFILAFLSIIIGYSLGNDFRIITLSIITGMCALWAVSKIKARTDLIIIFIILALVTIVQVFIFGLIYNENFHIILNDSVKFAVFTIPSASLVYYIFSGILERFFDITTDMRLLELSNSNSPLLKNLAIKAPGTYIHSIAVSYIAEACAEAINANVLLTRVGAYYHDIGKINNPQYFIENQYNVNIHDAISPQLSVMVIRSHVKLGIEYAKKYKLPKKVIDLIKEHHGTGLVSYFYQQFNDNNTDLVSVESQFRYEGPKPQSKEAAIIMIADSVEAASRSLKSPTPNKIETLVNSIVSGKLGDGQFNECQLTLADISKIKLICIKSLIHTLHKRLEYPQKQNEKEILEKNSKKFTDLNPNEEAQ